MKRNGIKFANRQPLMASKILAYDSTNIIFSSYGEYWRHLRKICTVDLLSAKRVQSFRWIREEEMSNVVGRIASSAGSPVNLTVHIFSSIYSVTARAAFGKKSRSHEQFISLAAEASRRASGFDFSDIFPSLTWLHCHQQNEAPTREGTQGRWILLEHRQY
ncbi:hypothetical protein SAY87_014516 [Trapa incisa]|uniref:Cytochrome P450 n=1 Tax=Trapa incisa TaxID=236973 RepID=A0AAN7GWY0_9MYRT|nr:hypothetical protein SAY87_014516 [Trapa incisa]